MSGVNDIRRTEVEREEGDERTRLSHERRKRERQEKWRGPWPLAPSSRRSFSRFVSSSCRFLTSFSPAGRRRENERVTALGFFGNTMETRNRLYKRLHFGILLSSLGLTVPHKDSNDPRSSFMIILL